MFGDFEAMLATYPEGIKKVPQAVNELWNGLVLNKQTKFFRGMGSCGSDGFWSYVYFS